jgi:hypothetical protein
MKQDEVELAHIRSRSCDLHFHNITRSFGYVAGWVVDKDYNAYDVTCRELPGYKPWHNTRNIRNIPK